MRSSNFILGSVAVVCMIFVSAQTATAADFPPGTYSIKVGNETWTAKVMKDGKITVNVNGEFAVEASYKSTKDEVEFKDVKGPRARANDKPGKYKWKLDGKKMTFTKINDDHPGRSGVLTAGEWTKEE